MIAISARSPLLLPDLRRERASRHLAVASETQHLRARPRHMAFIHGYIYEGSSVLDQRRSEPSYFYLTALTFLFPELVPSVSVWQ